MDWKNGQFQADFQYFHIPAQTGRPNRMEIIGKEDIMNLTISLALSKDVLDFMKDHHIF